MATTAQFTSVRVVCNNTLSAAIGNGEQKVKIPHLSKFSAKDVRESLTIAVSGWDEFLLQTRRMAATPLDGQAADAYPKRNTARSTSRNSRYSTQYTSVTP